MTRTVQNVFDIMRRALGRRNENDPDSNDNILLDYLNDAYSVTMSSDVKLFEQFGTLEFDIDETVTDGVYTFNDVGASSDFITLSHEAYISLAEPVGSSVSWSYLPIYQNPGEFTSIWGFNNEDILIAGFPTMMLYYGNEMTFRTIPDTTYKVRIYGYKQNADFPSSGNPSLPFDKWVRYLALLASFNYAQDFRYSAEALDRIKKSYSRERKLMLQNTHDQIKFSRTFPTF